MPEPLGDGQVVEPARGVDGGVDLVVLLLGVPEQGVVEAVQAGVPEGDTGVSACEPAERSEAARAGGKRTGKRSEAKPREQPREGMGREEGGKMSSAEAVARRSSHAEP